MINIVTKKPNDVKAQVAVARNWEYQHEHAYQWERDLGTEAFHGERSFWTFIPIEPNSLKNKVVYVACVGRGKEAYHVLQQAPYKVIANELGTGIYSITSILGKHRKDLIILRYDISYTPLKKGQVDIAICDHALQHVHDHKLAFSKLVEAVKNNGTVSICVYSYEHNFLLTHIVEPIKVILHYFPLSILRGLAFLPALVIYLIIHLIYVPVSQKYQRLPKPLPLFDHMLFWSSSSLKFIWSACFDLIHAPISFHFKKEEIEDLVAKNNLEKVKLINTHGTTWSLVARKLNK